MVQLHWPLVFLLPFIHLPSGKLAQMSLYGISTQIVCIKSSGKINLAFEYDISLKGKIEFGLKLLPAVKRGQLNA